MAAGDKKPLNAVACAWVAWVRSKENLHSTAADASPTQCNRACRTKKNRHPPSIYVHAHTHATGQKLDIVAASFSAVEANSPRGKQRQEACRCLRRNFLQYNTTAVQPPKKFEGWATFGIADSDARCMPRQETGKCRWDYRWYTLMV